MPVDVIRGDYFDLLLTEEIPRHKNMPQQPTGVNKRIGFRGRIEGNFNDDEEVS
jgi:hypothetical protein